MNELRRGNNNSHTNNAALEEEEGIWVANIHFSPEQIAREDGVLWWATME